MTKFAQTAALCFSSLCLLAWSAQIHAQAAPAALGPRFFQGFNVPDTAGTLHYSLNAAERVLFGYNGANTTISQTDLFADVGYLSGSEASPLSVLYSGGYLFNTAAQPSAFFHSLDVSQTIQKKHLNFVVADSFRYLPETPTGGLSGLAGLGNPGTPPIGTVGGSGQGILTPYATRIDNIASGSVGFPLTGLTSIHFIGDYAILRFPSVASAIENNVYSVGAGAKHIINQRNLVSADYVYRNFKFLNLNGSFVIQDLTAGYTRHWTRKFSTFLAAGPQFTSGSLLASNSSSLDYTITAEGTYIGSNSTLDAGYVRATNSGSGVTYGARNDTVRVTAGHKLSRQTSGSLTVGYARTEGLAVIASQSFNTSTFLGTVQLDHAITPTISTYASYTGENQSVGGVANGVTPLNGLVQVVAFGISYSPRPIHVGHH